MKLASERAEPIPVYAEMGSVNPVFILAGALAEQSDSDRQWSPRIGYDGGRAVLHKSRRSHGAARRGGRDFQRKFHKADE